MSRRRGRFFLVATMVLAASAAPASCLDRPDLDELLTKPVIVTKRAPNADFAAPRTFAMTEMIPLFTAFDAAPTGTVSPAIADPTLAEISAQLSSRGYQQVARTEGPDLGVGVTAVSQLRAVTSYGAWWGTGAATPTYWGYSGVGFDSSVTYVSFAWQSGTLIIELYDLRAARDAARRTGVVPSIAAPTTTVPIPVIWVTLIHGVVGEAGASLEAPPIESIQQAFIQSPYLTRPKTPSEVP